MVEISAFKDIKLLLLDGGTKSMANGETSDYVLTIPPNRFIILETIAFDPTQNGITVNSLKVDGVEMLRASVATTGAVVFYHPETHTVSTTLPSSYNPALIPIRDKMIINMTNTFVGVNDFVMFIYGYVHQDPLKEYAKYSSLQGG